MRVIVTRPAAQANDWTRRLQASGVDAVALPLIGIEPAADRDALADAWRAIDQQRLLVFVSPNAVEHFFAAAPKGPWPDSTFAASPGPGTTRALLELGVPAACILEPAPDSASFDSESLWATLGTREWRAERVLIVRGDGGRDWLAEMLRSRGALVATVAAYRRSAPVFEDSDARTLQAALDAPAAHVWFFSSSEAIDHLVAAAPSAAWTDARALATHPRIAGRARRHGFQHVVEARPAFDDVLACIQSFGP